MAVYELKFTNSEGESSVYYLIPKGDEIKMFYSNNDGSLEETAKGICNGWNFDGGEHEFFKPLKTEEANKILEEIKRKQLERRIFRFMGQ